MSDDVKARPLHVEEIREVKSGLMERLSDQARSLGILPNPEAQEKFLDPIIRKVDVDHAEQAAKPKLSKPEAEGRQVAADGEWLGEPGHSARAPEGATITREVVGEVLWDKKTGRVIAPFYQPEVDSPEKAAARECFRIMNLMPEWKDLIMRVAMSRAMSAKDKEKAYRRLLGKFRKLHGDPRKPLDPRIFVGGRK